MTTGILKIKELKAKILELNKSSREQIENFKNNRNKVNKLNLIQ